MDLVVREFLEREQQLRVIGRLGVGGFAEAWKVETSSGVQSVVKVSLQRIDEKNPTLKKELDNLTLVKAIAGHPHVVSLLDYWVVAEHLLTRWELASDGDLLALWERYNQQGQPGIPVAKLIPLIRDAADGLDFLHRKGIYHRDIKPRNLLLFQGRVKLGDLGLAKLVGASTGSHTGSGTLGYLPPEAWEEHRLTPTVDLYSLAATYIRLRTGNEPFGTNPMEILTRQQRGYPVLDGVGAAERPLLLAALDPDPAKRFSGGALAWVEELRRAITEPPAARQQDKTARDVSNEQILPQTPASASSQETTAAKMPRRHPVKTPRPTGSANAPNSATLDSSGQTSPVTAFPGSRRSEWLLLGFCAITLLFVLFLLLRSLPEKVAKPVVLPSVSTKVAEKVTPSVPEKDAEKATLSVPKSVEPLDERAAKSLQEACARKLGVPVTEENTIGMKLVLIPPGEFMMGSPDSDKDAYSDEKPPHKVRITKPFYLGAHEVTVGQFRRFIDQSHYDAGSDWKVAFEGQTNEDPVTCVSWNDAVAFCQWLSKKEGKTYRLPTEAEWEYACRAGTTTRWCFGDDEAALAKYAWYDGNSRNATHPVGQKRPNAWGLYDMHGNVWEWCADWYAEDYYGQSPPDDPTGPSSGTDRVLRGGSWFSSPGSPRSANRDRDRPGNRGHYDGFRVARTL